MSSMPIKIFREKCLQVINLVNASGKSITITKNGQPFAELVPAGKPRPNILGCLEGIVEIADDIKRPLLPSKAWKALR